MNHPGLPLPMLLEADDRLLDTITDLLEEAADNA